ncbi:MAG: 23S rRNA (adenine(2503)-C(2))-methyltransferase RlmN [Opitutaceae bacterium]|nr:23S rRNA (adenine(2503)-C(2))-methyltransferase RlmN [Opitutaceae bacterium]
MRTMIAVHDQPALRALARRQRVAVSELRTAEKRLYKHRLPVAEVLEALPEGTREAWMGEVDWQPLVLAQRRDSQLDGASKLAFRTTDGATIESVMLRFHTGRSSVCLSTQVGCAADCAFCATGRLGLRRNLTAGEIVDQVLQVARLFRTEGRVLRNLVFMGMGEPLHNEEALHEAVEALRDPERFNFADRFIVVSTVGVPAAMVRFARRFPGVNLALSLHSAREEVRRWLVPTTRRHSLADLRAALVEVAGLHGGRTVMIEYLLFDGLTDTEADLVALGEFVAGIPVHLNLIPFNPVAGTESLGLRSTPQARREAFGAALKRAGLKVTLRRSLGADIDGACGQLAQREGAERRS